MYSALPLKSTLAEPPIYNQTYHKKIAIAFPSSPVGIKKPNLLSLFAKLCQKSLKMSTSLKQTFILTIFGTKSERKNPIVKIGIKNPLL